MQSTMVGVGHEIGPYHLKFPDKRFATYTEGRVTYTRPVCYGMPKIQPKLLDTTFYLYPSVEAAQQGIDYGGTGFIVSLREKISGRPERCYSLYAVTNWHVACRDGCSVIRLHRKDGSIKIVDTDPSEWEFIQGGNDVAARPLALDRENDKFAHIPTELFVTRETIDSGRIGVGDDIFMVGRFIDHDGGERNQPAARFGHVSMLPQIIRQGALERESFCIDVHSRTGYSGSPVFVYRMVGGDFSSGETIHMERFMMFLGIHWGQFPEKWEIVNKEEADEESLLTEGKYIKGLSGMTCVAPAWSIIETLEADELVKKRETAREALAKFLKDKPLPPEEESETSVDGALVE